MTTDNIRGPLYELLLQKLPVCRASDGSLNVKTLHEAVNMSHEGVYKWLRANRLSGRAVDRLVELGATAENKALLRRTKPPTREDFLKFLF